MKLYKHQLMALKAMKDGCILNGGVGSGKTLTSLMYYKQNHSDEKLIVITTAVKRDSHDWEDEGVMVGIHAGDIIVDSWQNIAKYTHVENTFFIFDEQKLTGSGKWVKTFLKLAKTNDWILLSATPGDTWMSYIPVFIANGFYKNKTDFINKHVEYDPHSKYAKIKQFHNTLTLEKFRHAITVTMPDVRHTHRNCEFVYCKYDTKKYNTIMRDRWNEDEQKPIRTYQEAAVKLRELLAQDESRKEAAKRYIIETPRLIIFYNYNVELNILKEICRQLNVPCFERNGETHEDIPDIPRWVFLVQYTSGCEGWNCTSTDTILFYSQNYAYWVDEQAKGRIDRINTKYKELKYYTLTTKSPLENGIRLAVMQKKKFNVRQFFES